MKKLLPLIFTLIMVFSLCACGGEASSAESEVNADSQSEVVSKEDMLASASELILADFTNDVKENQLRAEDTYLNNYYTVSSFVISIESDHAKIGNPVPNGYSFNAYLPTDDLKQLNKGEKVTIVGEISSFSIETEDRTVAGNSYTANNINVDMSTAYLVTSTFEITGQINMYYMSIRDTNGKVTERPGVESAWYLAITDTNDIVYHLEDAIPVEHQVGTYISNVTISGTEVSKNANITISGKIYNKEIALDGWSNEPEYYMEDVELVSIN